MFTPLVTCVAMYASALGPLILPLRRSIRLMAGLRWAPDVPPKANTATAVSTAAADRWLCSMARAILSKVFVLTTCH